jgi:hypothetical protein
MFQLYRFRAGDIPEERKKKHGTTNTVPTGNKHYT